MLNYPIGYPYASYPFGYPPMYPTYSSMYASYPSWDYNQVMCATQTPENRICQLQTKISDLQIQQSCCQVNVFGINTMPAIEPESVKENLIYALDKIIFPDDPIRDYICREIKRIEDKYAKRINPLDTLL